ncbi:WecB/TagA/CpsF family glycosyltransferase [Shewanella intestini]|uniref:WecB/TagA/CpsF family glycosyltransferase n=1 Tax=Shewanella intestini TaxID=2017544 RepID=A0ABS5HYU6_9GAMM|nr:MULTISPECIES: WecB/TagA/CpsF family glycosyltransferase [Shewanella]MBR9726816.1 WecB/TagA/CpsF family glycosyltransferase [Shewanella intestini]MRG34618.1 WecB/TagA/CpsF family glycosyltransferase [Shewanella sp. XMDDZSB0408]
MLTPITKTSFSIRLFEVLISLLLLGLLSPILVVKCLYLWVKPEPIFERISFHGLNKPFTFIAFQSGIFAKSLGLLNVIKGQLGIVGSQAQYAVVEYQPYRLRPGLMSFEHMHRRMGISYDEHIDDLKLNTHLFHYLAACLRCLVGYSLSTQYIGTISQCVSIFRVKIDNLTMSEAVNGLIHQTKNGHACAHYAFVNTDCLNIAYNNKTYRETLNHCQQVFADGSGIRLASKLLQFTLKDNVNGTDMLPLLCEQAAKEQLGIYLLGAKPQVAEQAANNLQKRFQGLTISGTHDGYFDPSHSEQLMTQINDSGAHILLVALGAPLQEAWIAKHQAQLKVKVAVGVGGLFDFYANKVSRAPLAVRQMGMEWTWRLMQEPMRMWRRYLIGNPVFTFRVIIGRLFNNHLHDSLALTQDTKPSEESLDVLSSAAYLGQSDLRKQQYFFKLMLARVSKRTFDIVAASILMLLLSPLLMFTALCIYFESRGAVLFTQTRVGLNNQPFVMWKFRSMFIDAEARLAKLTQENEMQGGVLFKLKSDPRITRVGKFIRKASIDELPQLWNVLKGDMSLVGPRPALPSEVSQYQPSDHRRLLTKPGITCIWQVSGRSDIPFERQVELDVDYLYKQSFKQDFALLLKTIPAVLFARGAY